MGKKKDDFEQDLLDLDKIMTDSIRHDEERRAMNRKLKRERERRLLGITIAVIVVLLAAICTVVYFNYDLISTTILHRDAKPAQVQTTDDTQTAEDAENSAQGSMGQSQIVVTPETEIQTEAVAEAETEIPVSVVEPLSVEDGDALSQAKLMAAGYDYDGAIGLLSAQADYDSNIALQEAVAEFQSQKDACVAVDVYTVPHIFYHSLVNDPARAFNVEVLGQSAVDGMNAWMTTIEEFDAITQKLYDAGYVYVKLRDLVVETVDESGNVKFTPNNQLMLPPGKKPLVLSVDDLSYYHSYEKAGFPNMLVVDENGDVKCDYTAADGTESVGDYDVVPRLNTFLKEHPDGAYKGARGLIAMTGYDGVFGYRTDIDYEERQKLTEDQAKWLENHPDFNRQDEIAKAIVVADAIKASGWEFASHTWGHLSVTGQSAEVLQRDNERWVNNVGNIVGSVDTIIFAHGNDIGSWEGYSADNEQYNYYKNAGYNFYCNVDNSTPYWVQITDNYVRQGRIDLDGLLLYESKEGITTVLDNMFKASEVFDTRRPTPVVANGHA